MEEDGEVIKLKSPAVLWMKKKNGRENALNLNWYRNAHYFKLNKAKKLYKEAMRNQILGLPKFKTLIIHYKYFLRQKSDTGNIHSILEKFFLDGLVELGVLEDDNCEIVTKDSKEFCGYNREDPHCIIELRGWDEHGNKYVLNESK